jgi:inner membrane protein
VDNLTHSLVGALLGQAGLKRLSGRAMATLVIAANIPDIDAVATVLGTESLAIRRGITHGPVAMLFLPPLLVGLVLLWNRWRAAEQPVRPGALLLLAYIGTLSHPALDFLNSYGIRLLEPFSSRWVYGDTLFIIDLWVWAALILGFVWSRRAEKRGGRWRTPALASFTAIAAYIAGNGLITYRAEEIAWKELDSRQLMPTLVVANPEPLTFWRRSILWRNARVHGTSPFALGERFQLDHRSSQNNLSHPALAANRDRPDVAAFLFWSRMPFVAERDGRAYLMDQRFSSELTRGSFRVPLDVGSR